MSAFKAMLAEWVGRTGFSSADAANVLGCPVATLCKYEHGRSESSAHRWAAILAIID